MGLLDRVVCGASFLTGDVFECDLVHRRPVSVLCMLYKAGVTRCTPLVVFYLCRMRRCGLHVALLSHIGTLTRLLAAEPRTSAGLLFPCQYLCGRSWLPRIRWCGTGRLQEQAIAFFIGLAARSLFVSLLLFSLSLLSFYMGWYCGAGSSD